METPVKYQVGKPIYPKNKREQVLNSAYYQAVASTADAMLTAGGLYPVPDRQNFEWVIDAAIAFTDQLIEKVGERL
jgi:hypothetical protein